MRRVPIPRRLRSPANFSRDYISVQRAPQRGTAKCPAISRFNQEKEILLLRNLHFAAHEIREIT
jgi:hypothetical protein